MNEMMKPYKGKLTDYIKREDAIKALCKSKCIPGVLCPDEYCVEVREVFDDISAAQPERKKGKWTKISPASIYKCSVCGQNIMTQDIDVYSYCHGCGAEMEVSI